MTAEQLRQTYLSFFKQRRHSEISSKSLLPENDPTALFTSAGMHPLVPYLLGQEHPQGQRLVNCQPCIRTGDIEQVGDSAHLTFFEMLGNWSLGDYFKQEALQMSLEFLTSEQYLNLDVERLWVSVFAGADGIPRDDEAAAIWQKLGLPSERIHFLGREHNWWGPAGQTGPCGPDSEMFYDTGKPPCGPQCRPGICSCGKYIEIWNDVFMQYNKTAEGVYEPLSRRCVDTGMGLERTVAMLQGKSSVFETEIFTDILAAIGGATSGATSGATCELTTSSKPTSGGHRYAHSDSSIDRSFRIVADHLRTSVMILGDPLGVSPSNLGQGYILRRLLRRAIRHSQSLGIAEGQLGSIAQVVIASLCSAYPSLLAKQESILTEIAQEEQRFLHTLHRGEQELQRILGQLQQNAKGPKILSGRLAFKLYDTYGFPLELTEEIVAEKGLSIDKEGFEQAFTKHRKTSKKGADKTFKGGLADHSERTTAYHTATHLLHEALRQVLGQHVAQRGSNITAERMRFDFSHPQAMSPEEITAVEELVNRQIASDLAVSCQTMSLAQAQAQNARALFAGRYDEEVKVYAIGDFSLEVCGGPHVQRTGLLSHFRIAKEQSSSQGVRRIKAVLD